MRYFGCSTVVAGPELNIGSILTSRFLRKPLRIERRKGLSPRTEQLSVGFDTVFHLCNLRFGERDARLERLGGADVIVEVIEQSLHLANLDGLVRPQKCQL